MNAFKLPESFPHIGIPWPESLPSEIPNDRSRKQPFVYCTNEQPDRFSKVTINQLFNTSLYSLENPNFWIVQNISNGKIDRT